MNIFELIQLIIIFTGMAAALFTVLILTELVSPKFKKRFKGFYAVRLFWSFMFIGCVAFWITVIKMGIFIPTIAVVALVFLYVALHSNRRNEVL